MNPIDKLNLYKDSFTKSETMIYETIIKQPYIVIRGTIDILAKQTNTSKSAIMRLCKKIGYEGFAEFKFELSRHIISMEKDYTEDTSDPIQTILDQYSKHILAIQHYVNKQQLNHLVELFKKAHRTKILGANRTGLAAQQLRLRLAKLGFDAEAIVDPVLMSNQEDILKKGDLCIVFSILSEGNHYHTLINNLSEIGCDTIVITMNPKSPFINIATETIILPFISRSSYDSFLDDQAIFFVFIELFLSELASQTK